MLNWLDKKTGFSICVAFSLGLAMQYFINLTSDLWGNIDSWVKVATVFNSFAVIGVVVVWFQIKAEHERSRREKAVELLLKWNDSLMRETSLARKIVEDFSAGQCRSLYKQEKFLVTRKQHESIMEIMECAISGTTSNAVEDTKTDSTVDSDKKVSEEADSEKEFSKDNSKKISSSVGDNKVELNKREISKLRWLVLSYLNMFESILIAWQYSVADRKIIEAQFSYLFDTKNGCDGLSNFRAACGGETCYPASEIFSAHVREEKRKNLVSKGNVA